MSIGSTPGGITGINLSKLEILSATVLANNNSVTVTHQLGVIPTFAVAFATSDHASQGAKIINRTSTEFDVAFAFASTQPQNSSFLCLVGA